MSFVTKEWKDRLAEFAGRRKLTNVSTGEETTVDVSRAEGEVSQAGDAFSAANMNDLEQRIKDGFDKVDTNLEWKLLGSSSGDTALTLPSDFNELMIEATCNSITQLRYSFHFIKNQLTERSKSYHDGFYAHSSDCGSCLINASLSSVSLGRMAYNGTNYVGNSTITVYYK